ncbi:MAG: MgtC/SapB family protein [Elusimicrobiaceae bacterium]|jgi:putative Mg2+ transporter-C (MgtC) family protein|nr:MgtC/SapB family protein [Elusimicrobiaceae bacterium]MBT3954774.1 MgtC/SapB family protein [Elusimicrobiaceae bacterium]MBT4008711.1 MgtC/SapB family protein [Elusimicrobiaceae bacterium]MBT4403340.1 MgtC/SapB family protein [Elusimicrobiaceae bacterium]MBT4439827.1 MgtC/SapB family protein [Elusimicrobiaceae bacterium]
MFEMFLKIVIAIILGGVIGLEREYRDKPAGFRTNIFICLGSAIFTIMSLKMLTLYGFDPGRIAAQIVTGVGFLGAGAILRSGNKIRGLTTAAEVWLVASIGMCVGFGHYIVATFAVVLVVILQLFVNWDSLFFGGLKKAEVLHIKTKPDTKIFEKIEKIGKKHKISIGNHSFAKKDGLFNLRIIVPSQRRSFNKFLEELALLEEVVDLEN